MIFITLPVYFMANLLKLCDLRVYVHYVLCALCAHTHHVLRTQRDHVPHIPHAIRVLEPHLRRGPRSLVPRLHRTLRILVPYLPFDLGTIRASPFECSSCSHASRAHRNICLVYSLYHSHLLWSSFPTLSRKFSRIYDTSTTHKTILPLFDYLTL